MSNNSNFSGDLQVISTIISSGQQRFLAPGLTHYRKSEDGKLLELDIFDVDSEQFITYAVDTDTIQNNNCFESNQIIQILGIDPVVVSSPHSSQKENKNNNASSNNLLSDSIEKLLVSFAIFTSKMEGVKSSTSGNFVNGNIVVYQSVFTKKLLLQQQIQSKDYILETNNNQKAQKNFKARFLRTDLIYPLKLNQISRSYFYLDIHQCLGDVKGKTLFNINENAHKSIEQDLLDKTHIESDCLRYRQINQEHGMQVVNFEGMLSLLDNSRTSVNIPYPKIEVSEPENVKTDVGQTQLTEEERKKAVLSFLFPNREKNLEYERKQAHSKNINKSEDTSNHKQNTITENNTPYVVCQGAKTYTANSRFLFDNNVELNALGKNGEDYEHKDGFPVYENAVVIVDLGSYRTIILKHKKLIQISKMKEILLDLGFDKHDSIGGIKEIMIIDVLAEGGDDNIVIIFCFKSQQDTVYTAKIEFNYQLNEEDYSYIEKSVHYASQDDSQEIVDNTGINAGSPNKYNSQESHNEEEEEKNDKTFQKKLYNDGDSITDIKKIDLEIYFGVNNAHLSNVYFQNLNQVYYLQESQVVLRDIEKHSICLYNPELYNQIQKVKKMVMNSEAHPKQFTESSFGFFRAIMMINKCILYGEIKQYLEHKKDKNVDQIGVIQIVMKAEIVMQTIDFMLDASNSYNRLIKLLDKDGVEF